MATLADARKAVAIAISKITAQRMDPATTPQQLAALDNALDQLLPKQHAIEMAQLDESANAVADAANALQAVIDDARLDTLSQLKEQLSTLRTQLDDHHAELFAATKLARATDGAAPAEPPPVAAAPTQTPAAPAQAAPHDVIKPINSTNFGDLRAEYQQFYDTCTVAQGKQAAVDHELSRLTAGRQRYAAIATETPGMPWYLVGIIHGMEAGYRFDRHLHNGDPLTARTVNVPAGRPPEGHPPFSWEESARDALQFDGLANETDFSIAHLLYYFEKFNGFGYRSRGVPTPYLWGCSTHYKAGKFVADHVFSETAVSDQVGAAVLVKQLERTGGLTS